MKIEYRKTFSHELNRDMEYKIFGHAGKPCLVFPPQNGRFYDFENFGMIEAAREYIEAGRIQFFCCDGIDEETWSDVQGDPRRRIEQHERWFHYICDELVPEIHHIAQEANNGYHFPAIMTCGCSLGAFHALNFLFRRPDLFDKTLSMSGLYHAEYFFPNFHDDLVHLNSPMRMLADLSPDAPLADELRHRDIILSCGQGAWEQEMEDSTHRIKELFMQKNIDVWVDFWGYDVSHDWYWWKKQIYYFLQYMV